MSTLGLQLSRWARRCETALGMLAFCPCNSRAGTLNETVIRAAIPILFGLLLPCNEGKSDCAAGCPAIVIYLAKP